jgi:hypothetical protein
VRRARHLARAVGLQDRLAVGPGRHGHQCPLTWNSFNAREGGL